MSAPDLGPERSIDIEGAPVDAELFVDEGPHVSVVLAVLMAVGFLGALLFGALAREGTLAASGTRPAVEVIAATSAALTSPTSPPPTSPPPTSPPPSSSPPPPPPRRVAFFGDSISSETDPHLGPLLREHGITYRFEGFGGTATCDYLDEMAASAERFRPDVVVLLFTGNALTECMTSRTGGGRSILEGDDTIDLLAYTVAYELDTATAIETFGPGVEVILVGPMETRVGRPPAALIVDDIYRRNAESRPNVQYLAPIELVTPGGVYADELPCTFLEPCTFGEPVRVRAEDGAHLCPKQTFCFGGLRVAIAIADAVDAALLGA